MCVNKVNMTNVDEQITELDLAMASPVLLQLQVVQFKGAAGLLMFDPGSNVSLITKSFAKFLGIAKKGIATRQLVQVAGHKPEYWNTKAYTAILVDNSQGFTKLSALRWTQLPAQRQRWILLQWYTYSASKA